MSVTRTASSGLLQARLREFRDLSESFRQLADQELQDRKEFTQSSEIDSQTKDRLFDTLQVHSALWAFSRTIKENGLSHKWHLFRFSRVISRIRSWCEREGIEWREDWLRSMADQRSRDLPIATPAPVPGHRQAFGRL